MKNKAIRDAAKNYGVKLWELAEALGINDGNLSRKLRHELPDEEQAEIKVIRPDVNMRPLRPDHKEVCGE